MYPMLREGVSIGIFRYEGSDDLHYYIENEDGDEFEITKVLYSALIKADGTAPLNLPQRGKDIIPKLKRNKLIRTSRFVRDEGLFNRFIVFPISEKSSHWKVLWKALNAALPIASILLFIFAIHLKCESVSDTGYDFDHVIYYTMILVSLFLHEIGHLISGLAYGYKISDMGILLFGIFPIGAYVAHEDKKDATNKEKMQFALAGIEMNILIASVYLLISLTYYPLSLTMISVANVNVILAAINLLPAAGLDGESALSALCGTKSISKLAKKFLVDRKYRKKLFKAGLPGCVCICIFAITLLSMVLLRLLIGLDILFVLISLLCR